MDVDTQQNGHTAKLLLGLFQPKTKHGKELNRMSHPKISRLNVEIKFLDADFRSHPCPRCGTNSPRHGGAVRQALDIGLSKPILLSIRIGVYKCPHCTRNRYFRTPLNFLSPRNGYVNRCRQKLIETIDLDQVPISRAVKRMERDFFIPIVPSTGWKWHREGRPSKEKISEYEHLVVESFSGVLCVDEVYDGGYGILCARDPLNKRTIAYELSKQMNQGVVTQFFERLAAMGIKPDVVVSDGSSLYPKAIKDVWRFCKHQLCQFHWTQEIVEKALTGILDYHKQLPRSEKQPKRAKHNPQLEEERQKARQQKQDKLDVYWGRFLLVANRKSLTESQVSRLEDLIAKHPLLFPMRSLLDEVYGLFEDKPHPDVVSERLLNILRNQDYQASPYLRPVLKAIGNLEKVEKVALHLYFYNLNATSNDVERENRAFRKRQKAHYRIRSKEGIVALLERQLLRHGPPQSAQRLLRRYEELPPWEAEQKRTAWYRELELANG